MTGTFHHQSPSRLKLILYIFPFIYLSFGNVLAQDEARIDSLKQIITGSKEDTIKMGALFDMGEQYKYSLPDTAIAYFKQALELSDKTDLKEFKSSCLRQIGMVYETQGFYDQAIAEYFKALSVYEELDDLAGIASCYNDIAIIHYMQQSYELSIEYLTRSSQIKQELGDSLGMANYFTNMAAIKAEQGLLESAIDFVHQSVDLYKELDDKDGIATGYANLGAINYFLGNYQEALKYHFESVRIYEELNSEEGLAHSYSNISNLLFEMADSVATTKDQQSAYLNEGIMYGNKSLQKAEDIQAMHIESFVLKTLMLAHIRLGNTKETLEYAERYLATRDSMFNREQTRAIQDMETNYETEKKQQQIELQESQIMAKDAIIKQQNTFRNALIAGFLTVIIIIIIVVYAYVQKRKANKKIQEQNEQITEANEELRVLNETINMRNKEVMDSINYAERIQSAMLPPKSYISEHLNESFILYKPRDIVSGDFYWFDEVNQYLVLVAADCTGHGVPGAFMSMLGISFLTEIVQRRGIIQANQILNGLSRQIKYSLKQYGGHDETRDGMDMALCVLDLKNKVMQYAGANNPLYLIKAAEKDAVVTEFKADRMPLGYFPGEERSFTNHDIKLEQGDTFYIFSDGFIDQIGGDRDKRFMSRRFRNLLLKNHALPMNDQKEILDKTFSDWMRHNPQMDDVLIIGVRV